MPKGQFWTSFITVPAGQVDLVQDILEALFANPPPAAMSAFRIGDGGLWRVEVLTADKPDRDAIAAALSRGGATASTIDHEPLPDADWVALSRAAMKPVQAGRFYVYPRHHGDHIPANAVAILMEAGLAFGSGSHGSTRGCLLALDALARGRRKRRILDVGCGSGILAIAMAKLWHGPILACDIDPVAVAVTRANAAANHVGGRIRAFRADGVNHRAITLAAPFDLIVANILAGPLGAMAGHLSHCLARPGSLVLSGLIASQERQVRAAYARHGLRLSRRYDLDGWRTLVLSR